MKLPLDEGELRREATIRKFRIVRQEGGRQVAREVEPIIWKPAKIAKRVKPLIEEIREIQIMFCDFMPGEYSSHENRKTVFFN